MLVEWTTLLTLRFPPPRLCVAAQVISRGKDSFEPVAGRVRVEPTLEKVC